MTAEMEVRGMAFRDCDPLERALSFRIIAGEKRICALEAAAPLPTLPRFW